MALLSYLRKVKAIDVNKQYVLLAILKERCFKDFALMLNMPNNQSNETKHVPLHAATFTLRDLKRRKYESCFRTTYYQLRSCFHFGDHGQV